MDIYSIMLISLCVLATIDLVVGVSNDAVNFLNSAIGSRVASLRTILIIASIGVAVGAIFSSGLMEVARKGIFVPGNFTFNEIMVIFTAVMLTDILLLDFFNSLGLPTSTTVSIVFELLGAAVIVAVIKILEDAQGIDALWNYINTEKATQIILGILLSVVISFTVGAIIQYFSRLLFSFDFKRNIRRFGALFGGISLTAITYFILIKGLKGVSFVSAETLEWVAANNLVIIAGCFVFWVILSQMLITLRFDMFRFIILVGTFALALAFAGNDLVNFIGVPIAAWESYEQWTQSGADALSFSMEGLGGKVTTPTYLLVLAGLIMVITLWFSKKARTVVETGINLSRQDEGEEKFSPNYLSRIIVRATVNVNSALAKVLPQSFMQRLNRRFEQVSAEKKEDKPAFDLVRASVNLAVASILISIATNMKLPLSTTYVTFMVAMGTSLADRAWGRESAVYRVAGVFNVIGGWFVTAIVAFIAAGIFASILYFGGVVVLIALLLLASLMLARSFTSYRKKEKESAADKQRFDRADIITINEIIDEGSHNISEVIGRINTLYSDTVNHLSYQDLPKLKKAKKKLKKLEVMVDDLKGDVFYFIKSLDESSVEASRFYVLTLDYLQDMVQSIGYITKNSYEHVNNNHKGLKFNQIRDLKSIDSRTQKLFDAIEDTFGNSSFEGLQGLILEKKELLDTVSAMVQKQIERIRTTETSPKNTKLYFGVLLETKDLISATMNLLQLFKNFHQDAMKAKVKAR